MCECDSFFLASDALRRRAHRSRLLSSSRQRREVPEPKMKCQTEIEIDIGQRALACRRCVRVARAERATRQRPATSGHAASCCGLAIERLQLLDSRSPTGARYRSLRRRDRGAAAFRIIFRSRQCQMMSSSSSSVRRPAAAQKRAEARVSRRSASTRVSAMRSESLVGETGLCSLGGNRMPCRSRPLHRPRSLPGASSAMSRPADAACAERGRDHFAANQRAHISATTSASPSPAAVPPKPAVFIGYGHGGPRRTAPRTMAWMDQAP